MVKKDGVRRRAEGRRHYGVTATIKALPVKRSIQVRAKQLDWD